MDSQRKWLQGEKVVPNFGSWYVPLAQRKGELFSFIFKFKFNLKLDLDSIRINIIIDGSGTLKLISQDNTAGKGKEVYIHLSI